MKTEEKKISFKSFLLGIKKDKKKMFFALMIPLFLVVAIVAFFLSSGATKDASIELVDAQQTEISAVEIPVIDSVKYAQTKKSSKTELYRSDFFNIEKEEQRVAEEEKKAKELEFLVSNSSSSKAVPVSTAFQYEEDKGIQKIHYSNNFQSKSQQKSNSKPKEKTEVETFLPIDEAPVPQKRRRVPSDSYGNMTAKKTSKKELYRAVVANENKLVKSGSSVKIRIGEDMDVDGLLLKRNSIIIGTASMNRERMSINISSVKIDDQIKFVKWEIYSEDGNEGIAIPPSILNKMGTDASEEAIDKSKTSVETKVPFLGSLKVNLKKKVQDVEFILTSGHKIYIKEKRN